MELKQKHKIGWVKFTALRGFSPLGLDFVVVAGNSWLMVVNSNPPHKQHIYQADEGVQVAVGHRQLPCVAYAQKNNQPMVFVLVFPGFKIIRTIPETKNGKYLSLDFCDLDVLVAMVEMNDSIVINIWNWRTVERIAVVSSAIQDPVHTLSVSLVSPVRFIECDNLRIFGWQLFPSFRKSLPSRNKISFPGGMQTPIHAAWSPDGECFILDSNATLYTVNFETGVCQKEANFKSLKTGGQFISTPCLAVNFQGFVAHTGDQIAIIKKKGDDWSPVSKSKCPPIVGLTTLVNNAGKETILAWSQNNELLAFRNDTKTGPEIVTICSYSGGFDKICIIKPEAVQFLSHEKHANQLVLWNLNTGIKLTEIPVRAELLIMTCSLRNVVLGFSDGVVEILSFSMWTRFSIHPTRQPINDVQFLGNTAAFCVCSREIGEFYFIQKTAENWEVDAFLQADYEVVSFILQEVPVSLLVLSTPSRTGRNSVRVYDKINRTFVLHKEVILDELYTQMTQNVDNIFLVPFRSKLYKIFDRKLEQIASVLSGHLIAQFRLTVVGGSIISYGVDGLINKRDGRDIVWLLSHHRTDGGVAILDADAGGSVFVAGADNGCFVCHSMRVGNLDTRDDYQEFRWLGCEDELTWLEKWEIAKLEEVFEAERHKKVELLMRLDALKQTVKNLLDVNETCPDDEKLPVSCFELDITGRGAIADKEKITRLEIHQFERARIQVQDALSARIVESTWDLVETPARELCPVFPKSTSSVHSYGLLRIQMGEKVPWIMERKRLIRDFHALDYLEAWLSKRDGRPRTRFSRKVSLVSDVMDERGKKRLPFSSTTTYLFLPGRELPHSELQVNTQYQAKDIVVVTDGVIREMMVWFNNEFATVRTEKERELRSLTDRRERLRQVAHEIRELGGGCNLSPEDMAEPCWRATEKPETILTVLDSELLEQPYLSEEELEKQRMAALEEAIRLEKLRADDFRERALYAMMDGVLNKKWQDEIKKDVAKPAFMEEKKPDAWSEDEIRRAKIYQDEVEKLQTERERYKKLLITEFKQLAASAQETGARFDEKLKQLNGLKLRIESAICQEQLNILRMRMEIMEKIELTRKEQKLNSAISDGEHKLESLVDEAAKLQDALSEARTFLESLLTRDKNMEKNFKKDFPEYSPIICELLNKLSKKRPKLLSLNNASLLNELGRYAVQADDRSHRLPMPQECVEYLKGLDQLDGAVNSPALVNENSWETLCRLRRAKIDSELKVRAVGIELFETEQTAAVWQKMIKGCRETTYRKQAQLEGLLSDKRVKELDCSVQIVVPQRIVEVPATGKMDDFSGAVLLSRALIDDVNEAIHNAGEQKVKAMEKACEFRKGIIYKEWEHQKLRLRVEDLKAQLETLEHVHVTKELQEILNARARGDYVEKGFANIEKEIQAVNVRFQRAELGLMQTIDDYERKITNLDQQNNDLDLRIVALNKILGKRTLMRDVSAEQNAEKETKLRMKNIARRGRLAARAQELAAELAALQAERDLLCLRAYPTLISN